MKLARIALLGVFVAAGCPFSAIASPSQGGPSVAQAGSMPAANFGTPPSGQIPILYNDHHVYSKPDVLKQSRVLAALVKGGTLLIPLRSMFEQMGATVSYDAASKTATVTKPGSEVKVTVGKPEVLINGESRPLDVPPMIYQGNVLVPVRVISEGMGAYVQWVPDQHVVVVRYIPATPPPSPAPTMAPTPPPTPTPAPVKTPYNDLFVAGDYIISPKVYNEFSPGNTGTSSYAVRGAFEFTALNIPWMIEGSFEQFGYPHNCGSTSSSATLDPQCFVTGIGGGYQSFVPAFSARDSDVDARLGIRIFNPRVYIGVGYLWRWSNYGYPATNGVGFGIEKLPDLNVPLSFFGSFWYYPSITGNFFNDEFPQPITGHPGLTSATLQLGYNLYKYQVGADYVIGSSPIFIEAGWMGENLTNKTNAPIGVTANGPFAGLGVKF
ncbi:MAG: copper amine oxidase N-terminal domain-containing protein [Candidatus Tumulicola sp.]